MTFQNFLRLFMDVAIFEDYDRYLAEVGGSVSEKDLPALPMIWALGKEGTRGIRAITGLSQNAFAQKYDMPKRTLEGWEQEHSNPHEYALNFLRYTVLMDVLESKEGEESV